MGLVIGEYTSINISHIRKVKTILDKDNVPGFLVVYSNGDMEIFSIKEFFHTSIQTTVDAEMCKSLNQTFFKDK